MWPLQEIREQTRRDEEVELRQGTVKWEVEVSLLQINLCSDTAAGRFLLAAQKCQLSGSELPTSQRKALCIDMQVHIHPLQYSVLVLTVHGAGTVSTHEALPPEMVRDSIPHDRPAHTVIDYFTAIQSVARLLQGFFL